MALLQREACQLGKNGGGGGGGGGGIAWLEKCNGGGKRGILSKYLYTVLPGTGKLWGSYPGETPVRGSLNVVVLVLWSTKYGMPSFVYLISQPGGSGFSVPKFLPQQEPGGITWTTASGIQSEPSSRQTRKKAGLDKNQNRSFHLGNLPLSSTCLKLFWTTVAQSSVNGKTSHKNVRPRLTGEICLPDRNIY